MTEVVILILVVLAIAALTVYFLRSPMGMELVRRKTVSTILSDVRVRQSVAPELPLHEIYYLIAEERANKSQWLIEFEYLYKLRDAGCFDERTAPMPEKFADFMAKMEEKIRLSASGVGQRV